MSEKKTDGAMRLWEAMEGVDPELLLRSEKKTEKKKVVPFARFTRAAAACLALIVVGGACWAAVHNGGRQMSKSAENAAATMETQSISQNSSVKGEQAADMGGEAYATEEAHKDEYESDKTAQASSGMSNSPEAITGAQSMEEAASPDYEGRLKQTLPSLKTWLTLKRNGDFQSDTVTFYNSETEGENSLSFFTQETQYLDDKQLEVAFDTQTPIIITDKVCAAIIYAYVSALEVSPTDDQSFDHFVTVRVYDQQKCMTDAYTISEKYLMLMGLPGTYEILDEDYDYDTLVTFLREAAREE